ncbi:MAG: AAA family ATPase [Candidatus Coproplasma sp.]
MAVSINLESNFIEIKKDIERYYSIGDYAQTLKLIERAMPLCSQIYSETSDMDKKEVMRQNAATLKQMYETCKRKVGDTEELTYDRRDNQPDNSRQNANKPAAQGANAKNQGGSKESKESKDGAKGEINYVFNGVNVEDFISNESNDVVTFEDVKGMEDEKALIEREFFLTEEEREFNEFLGKKAKTFILLYGVPGTGKTFFAKAISQELKMRSGDDVPFFSVVGSQLSDCKVGATEKNIQAVFEFCKQFEHCVLFIDEFDTIAPDRKQANGDPTAASRVTVLLQMMDGFSSSKGTLVIAATNCPYNLDGAILSRANTRIEIPLPTYEVIYATLYAKIGSILADDVDLPKLAVRLDGYSNRDIKHFMEAMKDMLSDEFKRSRSKGDTRQFSEYRYTNEIIDRAFEKVVPTTKQSDIDRIEKFKLLGE